MIGNLAHRQHPDSTRTPSFRAKQAGAFSYLPLPRKDGLRGETSAPSRAFRGMKSPLVSAGFIAHLLLRRFRLNLLLCSGLLVLTFSLNAQTPVPLAHGDVPGEPHHHLKIENSFVRAYYVEVAPHADTQLHQHDHDYIFVTLGATDVINAVLGKPEVHLVLKDGDVHFSRGGFAHVARNLSDAPFRNVTIEFLHAQGAVHNLCEKVVDGPLGDCRRVHNPSSSTTPLFETGEALAELVTIDPKAAFGGILPSDRLLVALDQAELEMQIPGKPAVQFRSGEMLWLSAGGTQTITNLADAPSRYLSISFKHSATPKKS